MRAIKKFGITMVTAVAAAGTTTAGTFVWVGGSGNWSNAAMWGGSTPAAGSDVQIDNGNAAASSVLFDTSILIANLTIDANDMLDMSAAGNRTLNITGSITNNGVIRMADTDAGAAQQLQIRGEVPLNGSGMLIFDSTDDNRIQAGLNTATDRLIVGANQLITTSALSLVDESFIQVRVTNNGIIEANEGQLDLESNPKINANLMRAVNGGLLRLQTTIENTGADIEADATSTIGLSGATIVGGSLGGSGLFSIDNLDATFDGTGEAVTIGSGATVELVDATGQRLTLRGTIVNNGQIVVRDFGSNINDIGIIGAVSLEGSGLVRLEGDDDSRIIALVSAVNDILTIGPSQTITTSADTLIANAFINCQVVNNGVIEANEGELELNTHNPKVNNNIMRARGGGNLFFNNVVVENAAGALTADAGSTITYSGSARVNGGTVNGSGAHKVNTVIFDGVTNPISIGAGTTIDLVGGSSKRLRLEGNIVNDGLIVLNDQGGAVNDIAIVGPVMLDGSGAVRLEGNDDSRIIALISGANDVLHIGANQTITTDANTTIGNAFINCRVVNNGVVEANAGELEFNTHSPKTNNSTFRALNGGNLLLDGITVENVNGEITAAADSTVSYTALARIQGGTLNGAGRHLVTAGDVILDGAANPVTIDAGSTIDMTTTSGELLRLEGTIINNGTILVEDNGGSSSNVGIAGPVALNGSGMIVLSGDDDSIITALINGTTDVLTIGANQTITTTADTLANNCLINCRFVNNGIIQADGGEIDIEQHAPKINNSIMRSINGGNMRIEGGMVIENANGIFDVNPGSTLTLVSTGRINGGVINCSGSLATTNSLATLDGVTIRPGDSPGAMTYAGPISPTMTAASVLEIELGGFTPISQHDVANTANQMRLGGTLRAVAISGHSPQLSDRYTIMNVGSFTGTFSGFAAVGFSDPTLSVRLDTTGGTTGQLVVVRVGDMNCDGVISVSDIGPFVVALTDPAGYATQFPACEIFNGDINGDGAISVSDIGPFVALLTGG